MKNEVAFGQVTNITPGLDEDLDCFIVTVEASVMQASPAALVTIVDQTSLVEQKGDQHKLKGDQVQQSFDDIANSNVFNVDQKLVKGI